MKRIPFGGFALILATLFGMVQFGAPAAFAAPASGTQQKNSKTKITHPNYHVRTLPGLTGPTQKSSKQKAKKRAKKLEKATLQNEAFVGTITKKNGHYVLTAGMFTFKLTNQKKVKKYKGKKVRVTGKLNPETNRIMVHQIKKASG